MNPRMACAVGCVLLLQGAPAAAEIYKSVDADGNIVFSEKPPAGAEAEVIKPRYARPPSGGASVPAPATGVNEPGSPAPEAATQSAAESAEPTPEQLAAKAANCSNARSQIELLNGARANRLQYVNEAGELAFYSEEQRLARLREARAAAGKYCE